MTAHAFSLLNDESREDVLTCQGIHLGQREKNGLYFDLYQVEGFYVEFCYQVSKSSRVTTTIFSETDLLDPYLPVDVFPEEVTQVLHN